MIIYKLMLKYVLFSRKGGKKKLNIRFVLNIDII